MTHDADTLLRHADQAMYSAKQSGKNRYYLYDAENDQRARTHQEFLRRLGQALAENEFELYYQPKVDMRSLQLVGAEALIRWNHPERGLLAPAEFLSAIEGTALEVELGDWVVAAALAQLDKWHQAGLPMELSINISARHLQARDFAWKLKRKLLRYPSLPKGGGAGDGGAGRHPQGERYHRTLPQYRHQFRAGRFRHRLLLAVVSGTPAGRHAQDRPILHSRHAARQRRPGHRAGRHRAGQGVRPQDRGRGKIANNIIKEICPRNIASFKDYKYLPKDKITKEIPKKELLIVREELGKVIGYRLDLESFKFFDCFIKKYQKNTTNDYFKEIELLCATFIYEPYLYDKITVILPDVTERIESFIENLIFSNDKIYINLTYKWNKKDIVHLFFIVFKNEKLLSKLTIERFKKLIEFTEQVDSTINYILYKLVKYFPLNTYQFVEKKYDIQIKGLITKLKDDDSIPNKEIKKYYNFITSLPSRTFNHSFHN